MKDVEYATKGNIENCSKHILDNRIKLNEACDKIKELELKILDLENQLLIVEGGQNSLAKNYHNFVTEDRIDEILFRLAERIDDSQVMNWW